MMFLTLQVLMSSGQTEKLTFNVQRLLIQRWHFALLGPGEGAALYFLFWEMRACAWR